MSLKSLSHRENYNIVLREGATAFSTSCTLKQFSGPYTISINSVLSSIILGFFVHVATIDASLEGSSPNSATEISSPVSTYYRASCCTSQSQGWVTEYIYWLGNIRRD